MNLLPVPISLAIVGAVAALVAWRYRRAHPAPDFTINGVAIFTPVPEAKDWVSAHRYEIAHALNDAEAFWTARASDERQIKALRKLGGKGSKVHFGGRIHGERGHTGYRDSHLWFPTETERPAYLHGHEREDWQVVMLDTLKHERSHVYSLAFGLRPDTPGAVADEWMRQQGLKW